MHLKNVYSFFVIFIFIFSIFLPINTVLGNGGWCNVADSCILGGPLGESGVCSPNYSQNWCDCGTSATYRCDRGAQDKECRGVYGNANNAYCFPGETCYCDSIIVSGCTNPLADNYNPSANQDDGSCVITQPGWQNLNFWVKDQNNSPRQAALVTIGQNFGNGTTRNTDGSGFANFGVPQNNSVNYTVSASNCNTVSGSATVNTSDVNINVGLNCSNPGSGSPPNPGPQPAVGVVESATCTAITGYAGDPDNINTEIGVYLFSGNTFQAGGTYVADTMTNIYRADVNANFGATGNHGFSIPYPDSLRDNVARNFYVHPRDLGDTGPFTRLFYPSWGVNNVITLQCPPIPTTPATNNVSISSPMVTPNGSTQYTISHTGSDVGGGSKITYQYALLRDANGTNKGWLAWNNNIDSWATHKNPRACTGGGYAAILSSGGWAGYGDQYIRLTGCTTSMSGNSRTTNFTVVFEPTYNVTLTGNDIWGITYNTNNNYSPWTLFDLNFGLNMPAVNSVTISPASVTPNNSTQHTITAVASDPTSGSNIIQVYALANSNVNDQNSAPYRGFLTWGSTDWWPSDKNHMACTGGGWAVVQSVSNPWSEPTYVNLVSCSTSVSGNNRTVNFVVRYDTSFTTPTTGNILWGFAYNSFAHPSGWRPGTTFSLTLPIAGSCGTANGKTYASGVTAYSPDTQCSAGTPSTTAFPAQGATVNWTCSGQNGGASSGTCSASRAVVVVNGVCGTANTTYGSGVTTYGSDTFCSAGTASPASPAFPAAGSSTNWTCVGSGTGHTDASCTAVRSAVATYSLSVTATSSLGGSVTSAPAGISCGATCTAPFANNSSVTLTAVPKSSFWRFSGWGGDCSGTVNTCSVLVNGNKNVIANFVPRSFIYKEF